jgi:hypothetical protein
LSVPVAVANEACEVESSRLLFGILSWFVFEPKELASLKCVVVEFRGVISAETLVSASDSRGARVLSGKYVVDADPFRWSLSMLLSSCSSLERLFWVEGKLLPLGRELRLVGRVPLALAAIGATSEASDSCVEVAELSSKVSWRASERSWRMDPGLGTFCSASPK